ncbi:MAG: hypothetical protein JNK02_06545 [Planctomycetes bacterium]|nr:hypothetical protein [Planctomycetota bacterium]
MKRGAAGLWLGAISATIVFLLVLLDPSASSPGPISAVHALSAGIDEHDCAACHGSARSDLRTACAACHAEVEVDVQRGRGFHGQLADGGTCGRCHAEHHGAGFELASAGAFALAGVPDRAAYDHAGLDFRLGGDHAAGLACSRCHEHADAPLLASGARRFRGLSQECASCHDDPHAGKLPDCRACHGETEPFALAAAFAHPATFALEGAHARARCVDCHPRGGEFAIEAGGGAEATRAARDCAACHASPHAAPFVAALAARLSVAAGASCASCHPVESGPFREPRALTAAEHAATGFALDPPHARATCADCHPRIDAPAAHTGAFADYRAAHPGRAADDCAACHADPHGGQFAQGATGVTDCLACHERLRFDPVVFGAREHARTGFALDGAHQSSSCHACHERRGDAPRAFRGTNAQCAACHADVHAGAFARGAASPADRERAQDCAACHTTTSFARGQDFEHARWTGFALQGEHSGLACEACHPRRAVRDAHGRAFGLVAEAFPGPTDDCATCHIDAHGGYFARAPSAPACAACHDPHGFEAAAVGFDHARWTGFPLVGAHARSACAACHAQRADGTRTLVHSGARGPQDCAACHADPHAGAFAARGAGTECASCHSSESFAPALPGSFDHGSWTGFALGGAHAAALCTSCHPRLAARDATGRSFARAAGASCSDCHADPHAAQFARGGATDCAACHATGPDFLALVFDHQRDARFALDSVHARLSCSACHVPWPLPGGGSAVRYKPLGTACGDCHDPRGGQR